MRFVCLSVNSTEPNASPDQPALMLQNQGQGGYDETNVLIIDKIIKTSEVTYEKKTVGDDSSSLGNINHPQNIVAESGQDTPQTGGMCSHPSATEGENGGSEVPGTVQEAQLGNISQLTEHCQVWALSCLSASSFFLHTDDNINILYGSFLQYELLAFPPCLSCFSCFLWYIPCL